MLPNNPYSNKSPTYFEKNSPTLKFAGYKDRPDITKANNLTISDSRFEPINKNPEVLSSTKRIPAVSFKFSTARGELYKPSGSVGGFYTPQKEATMNRLDKGLVRFESSIDRDAKPGLGLTTKPDDSYNYSAAIQAKTKTTKRRVLSISNFSKEPARDDILLKQTEEHRNIWLDNNKEERQMELDARKSRKSSTIPSSFLMNA